MQRSSAPADDSETLAEAAAWIDAALPQPATNTVVFIGAGLGHALDVLETRLPGTRALVLEPEPEITNAMLARRDWTRWLADGRLAILHGPDYAGAARIAQNFRDLHTAPVLVHPRLARHQPEAIERARQALSRLTFETSANEGARRGSAGRYLLHTLANLPRLARESDVVALSGLGAGLPAVIAAAGPSLNRNAHELAPFRDRAILIACDTAARPLSIVNMDPDFVVASDSSRVNAAHIATLPPGKSWLVAEGSLHPTAFNSFERRSFVFRVGKHEPWPWLSSLGLHRGVLDTWGSVATSAFSLALLLGCDPIVVIGGDFAFTNNQPYCRGTAFESQWGAWAWAGTRHEQIWEAAISKWPPVSATDVHGRPARTAKHLVAFRDWIVERAAAPPHVRVINATGEGLLHGATIEQLDVTTALASRPAADIETLNKVLRLAHTSARGDVRRVLSGIDAVLSEAGRDTRQTWISFAEGGTTDATIGQALRSPEYVAWALATQFGPVPVPELS